MISERHDRRTYLEQLRGRMPYLPPRASACPLIAIRIPAVLLHILRRDGLLKLDLILELGEVVAPFWRREDGGILREVPVVRLLSATTTRSGLAAPAGGGLKLETHVVQAVVDKVPDEHLHFRWRFLPGPKLGRCDSAIVDMLSSAAERK